MVLALCSHCIHLMILKLYWRCLFLAKGWWNAIISSLWSIEILMSEIVALYFLTIFTISFRDFGSDSDCELICHDWVIHSLVEGSSSLCLFIVHLSSRSLATHAHLGLSGSGCHHLLSQPTFIASYLSFMLGAPMPPLVIGRITLLHAIWPFQPLHMKAGMFFSMSDRVSQGIPFTVIR